MKTPEAAVWSWSETEGPARLRSEVEQHGFTLFQLDDTKAAGVASLAPWAFAERLLGRGQVSLVERQPIRAVAGGRSFASSQVPTPLHSDSQLFAGVPPQLQVMLCVRPAAQGGQSLLLDTWPLLLALQHEDPALWRRLFAVPRRQSFVFGDVLGPTVSWRGGSLVFTHSPMAAADAEAVAVNALLGRTAKVVLPIRAGEVLVLNNHRVLHGRHGFADTQREFVRLLVWGKTPLAAPPELAAYAQQVARRTAQQLADGPPVVRRHLGLETPPEPAARTRLELVLALLRGVPPGQLAAQNGVPEPELYRYRDAALAAAAHALSDAELQSESYEPQLATALRTLRPPP